MQTEITEINDMFLSPIIINNSEIVFNYVFREGNFKMFALCPLTTADKYTFYLQDKSI